MTLALEYTNDHRSFVAKYLFERRERVPTDRTLHYKAIGVQVLVLLLACFAAVEAQNIALLGCFAFLLLALLARGLPYSRVAKNLEAAAAKTFPTRKHRLEVSEKGLNEFVEGIESFAPWSSVHTFAIVRDVLIVQLSAGLFAMVPRYSLAQSSATVEQFVDELRRRGVREQAVTAT